ncbi:MAG: Ig-like domain-containing protein [Paludibacteraceae bacterium]|nr:Ig-like domain-containing protein [Paludibacteraceae bacterium]
MKRLTLLLSALMVALTSVFADVVAKIGNAEYESLAEAVAAVQNDETIELQADIELASTITLNVDKTYAIDLNGKTISNDTLVTHAKTMIVLNAGEVTLRNGVIASPNSRGVTANTGKLTLSGVSVNTGLRALCVYDDAHVVLEYGSSLTSQVDHVVYVWGDTGKNPVFDCAGTVSGTQTTGIYTTSEDPSSPVINIAATAVVSNWRGMFLATGTCNIAPGATVAANGDVAIVVGFDKTIARNPVLNCAGNVRATGENFAISGNGTDAGHPEVNILPGASVVSEDVAIYQPENGTLNISGGVIEGTTAVYAKCGHVNVTGGQLKATGEAAEYNYYGNGANSTGNALVLDNCGYPGGVPTASVTGGEFVSENAAPVGSYVLVEKNGSPTNLETVDNFIEGGSFVGADITAAELFVPTAVIGTPDIKANPSELSFAGHSYKRGETGVLFRDTLFAQLTLENLTETLQVSMGDANSIFAARLSNDTVFVSYEATAAGQYADVVNISSGSVNKQIAVSVSIEELVPVITVEPANWSTAVELEDGIANAEQAFTISVSNKVADAECALKYALGSPFSWSAAESKVVFSVNAVGNYKDTLIVSATGADMVKVPLEVNVEEPAPVPGFVRVTAGPTDWSGKYLLVYETSGTAGYVFNGTDANNNGKAVVISEGKIKQAGNEDYTITVASMEGGYSLKIGDKYLSGKAGNSALVLADAAVLNTLSFKNGKAEIVSNGTYLQYNSNSSRFRYYSDTTYNNIKSVALYKLEEPEVPTTAISVSPKEATIKVGEQVTLSFDRDGNDEMVWGSADESIATVENGVVTGVAEGTVKIYVSANNIGDTCMVTVTKVVPVITVGTTSLSFGNLSVEEAEAGKSLETAVSVTENAVLSVEVTGAQKDHFAASIAEGKLTVVFTADAAGTYAATAVVKAEGAASKEVALNAIVKAAPIVGVTKNDTIVFGVTGLPTTGEGISYADTSFAVPSGAEYAINAASGELGGEFIQMRSKNGNSGIICTKSAGNIASVIVKFNPNKPNSTDVLQGKGTVNVYASNEPFTAIASMYGTGSNPIAKLSYGNGSRQVYEFEEDYEYIGLRSNDGAIYLDSIIIVREKPAPVATTTLAVSPDTAEIEIGKSVTLNVQRDGNDELVWRSENDSIAQVLGGVVTGVAAGEVKIFATANQISDSCVIVVKEAADIETKTIAEFIAAKGGKCYLTGVVSNIKRDKDGSYNKYGNFDFTDESGTIYVYGLLTAEGVAQKFKEMGVDEKDTLTILAEEYKLYNTTDEVVNATFVSVKKFQADTLDVVFTDLQATYYGETEKGNHIFGLDLYAFENWEEDEEGYEYPVGDGVFASLDLYSSRAHSFAGSYSFDLGEDAAGGIGTEFSYVVITQGTDTVELGIVDGTITITSLGEDNYRVEYSFTDEAGHAYAGVIESTEILAYDEDGYDYPIDNTEGVENTHVKIDMDGPFYNIQGTRVDRNTPGILIQKGRKFIIVQ